jgi:hypothetical protein
VFPVPVISYRERMETETALEKLSFFFFEFSLLKRTTFILSRVLVTINGVWIGEQIQFTVTHALGFSVFTSRILVTELKHFHCDYIF